MFKYLPHIVCSLALSTLATYASNTNAQETSSAAWNDLQTLSSDVMQGRAVGSEGSALAREYIIKRIKEIGLKPCDDATDFIQEFNFSNRRLEKFLGKNIVACQASVTSSNATDIKVNANQEKIILISAHYDHLGTKNGRIYHGADDNASGVAATLAIATTMQNKLPKHKMMYVFFDAEEQGKLGAFAFVKNNPLLKEKIAININFDMIARGDKGEIYASGAHYTPSLKPLLESMEKDNNIRLLFGHDKPDQGSDNWTTQSDHDAFFKAEIPHLYFGVEDHVDYHQVTDTIEKINPLFFKSSVELLTNSVYLIDNALMTQNFSKERKQYVQ